MPRLPKTVAPTNTFPPKLITLINDEDGAKYVGKTQAGILFFLTTPFLPAERTPNTPGCEFIALYTFDPSGKFLDAIIDNLGPRSMVDEHSAKARIGNLLRSLGEHEYCAIRIAPFRVHRFGVDFGLIPRPPESPEERGCVTVEPGDYMCFWPPWDDGYYDT